MTDETPGIGHNSGKTVNGIAADRLQSLLERIERLQEEKAALSEDIKDIFAEGKSAGFNVKVMRALITIRKTQPDTLAEFETELDLYRLALGMV